MRILMVTQSDTGDNPFVNSLVSGLIACGNEVECGLHLFWNSFENYDLLFFQWPELIFGWRKGQIDIERLSRHFDRIKNTRVKTLITCHNLHPHNNDETTVELYDLVYSKVDAFHHMGEYSYQLMKEKYPQKYHFVAPHHIADILWDNKFGSKDARKALSIPRNNIVISSFGAFRNLDEERLFVDLAKDFLGNKVTFLAPRISLGHLYNGRHLNKTLVFLYKRISYMVLSIRAHGFLSQEELKMWLSASDIVFIQRKEILNSGNVPLAFSAGKIVVGPNLGNVGEILKKTGNFTFNPNDRASVKKAVQDAINDVMNKTQLGAKNYQYSKDNWSTKRVCTLINNEIARICEL